MLGLVASMFTASPSLTSAQDDPTPESGGGGFFQQTPVADDEDEDDDAGGGFGIEVTDDEDEAIDETDEGISNESDRYEFAADAWEGGFYRGDAEWYGRPWVSLYGAQSEYPRATVTFELTRDPSEPLIVWFDGLDDELGEQAQIAISINGQRVFEGESWFGAWDGTGQGENAPWTTVRLTIPAGMFVAGVNRITVSNLTPAANFGGPPYILLAEGGVESGEGDLFGPADEDEITVEIEIDGPYE
jgi:hypothetical protein